MHVGLMPTPLDPSPYDTYVETRQYYIHPRTGMRASKALIAKLKIKPTTFLYLKRSEDGSTIERVKVGQYESIFPVHGIIDRNLSETLSRFNVYHKIWSNIAGQIRISINGMQAGRRIKEVLHIPFFRRHWELKFHGRDDFKRYIKASILSALRKKGLRISNPKESRGRIHSLEQNKKGLESILYLERDQKKITRIKSHIDSIQRAIRDQKKSKQLSRVTIKIEKLGLQGE